MTSTRFWLLFCTAIALAIALFGAPVFAYGHKSSGKTRPVVKIGKPYQAELRIQAKPSGFSPQFLRNEDASAAYLQWRNSVQFRTPSKK